MTTDEDKERFLSKIRKTPSGCWRWTACIIKSGHGQFRFGSKPNSKVVGAHRFSFLIHNGPITEGLHVLHSCNNPACVNPNHLRLGTDLENRRDRWRIFTPKKKCIHGHAFTNKNTYRPPKEPRARHCRECHRLKEATYRVKRRTT